MYFLFFLINFVHHDLKNWNSAAESKEQNFTPDFTNVKYFGTKPAQ